MNFSGFGRDIVTKAAMALVWAAAGTVGSAAAMSPVIGPPIKWAGGWGAAFPLGGYVHIVQVPAGLNLMVTDLILGNPNNIPLQFRLLVGSPGCSGEIPGSAVRLSAVTIPAQDSMQIALQTGIGFSGGQWVCGFTSIGGNLEFTARGFFFTPAPAN